MRLSEALKEGKRVWREKGQDVMIEVGKAVLTFHEGKLEMIQDDNGKIVPFDERSVLVKE